MNAVMLVLIFHVAGTPVESVKLVDGGLFPTTAACQERRATLGGITDLAGAMCVSTNVNLRRSM